MFTESGREVQQTSHRPVVGKVETRKEIFSYIESLDNASRLRNF